MTLRDTDTCASLTRESFGIRSEPQRTPDAGKTMTDREMLELAAKAAAEAGRAMRDAMHTAITDQDMKGVCDEVAKK